MYSKLQFYFICLESPSLSITRNVTWLQLHVHFLLRFQRDNGSPTPSEIIIATEKAGGLVRAICCDIEHAELTQAFQQMGYRFTLDNFIVVCVNIKRLTDTFRSRDREMRGQAVMQYEDFIGLALGAHK